MFLSPTNGKIAPCFPCETSLFAIKYRAHSHKNAKKKKDRKKCFFMLLVFNKYNITVIVMAMTILLLFVLVYTEII